MQVPPVLVGTPDPDPYPIMVFAESRPGVIDPTTNATFTDLAAAESYGRMLAAGGLFVSVWVREGSGQVRDLMGPNVNPDAAEDPDEVQITVVTDEVVLDVARALSRHNQPEVPLAPHEEPDAWAIWNEALEAEMGHSAQGTLEVDGYSPATFFDMFRAGISPEVAATRIIGALFVTPAGTVYRLETAQRDATEREYAEQYVLLPEDQSDVRYRIRLPDDAVLVWTPDRGLIPR